MYGALNFNITRPIASALIHFEQRSSIISYVVKPESLYIVFVRIVIKLAVHWILISVYHRKINL